MKFTSRLVVKKSLVAWTLSGIQDSREVHKRRNSLRWQGYICYSESMSSLQVET